MAVKKNGLVADRPVVSIRPAPALKEKLEQAAGQNGRSMAREVEVRLEQSFESRALPSDMQNVFATFSNEQIAYIRDNESISQYISVVSEAFMRITRLATESEMSEDDTRIALREAVEYLTSWFVWRGEDIVRAEIPRGSRLVEQPPAEIGRKVAEDFMIYRSAFFEGGALEDTFAGRIMNVYSGDGRTRINSAAGDADAE